MTALDNLKRLPQNRTLLPSEVAALIGEFEQRERKVERLIAAWREMEPQIAERDHVEEPTYYKMVDAVADLQADSPPPIARDPIPDTGGKIKW